MDKNEFEIIREYFADPRLCFAREGIIVGTGDDGAVLRPPANKSVVVSTDVLNAGRHFPLDADPDVIGYRSLAVNLSDLAAMAAEPWCFTLGLTIPGFEHDWLNGFSSGLERLARQYDCPLVGGDMNRGPLSIAIQVHGLIGGEALLRSGAKPGDTIYVSGCLGDAAVALLCMDLPTHLGAEFQLSGSVTDEQREYLCNRYYYPQPQIELAAKLRPLLTAAIDISDGLAGDLGHILAASKVGARLHTDRLPVSDALRAALNDPNRHRAALFGGDDYELCFTAPARHHDEIVACAAGLGLAVTAVGEIVAEPGLELSGAAALQSDIHQHAYRHF